MGWIWKVGEVDLFTSALASRTKWRFRIDEGLGMERMRAMVFVNQCRQYVLTREWRRKTMMI